MWPSPRHDPSALEPEGGTVRLLVAVVVHTRLTRSPRRARMARTAGRDTAALRGAVPARIRSMHSRQHARTGLMQVSGMAPLLASKGMPITQLAGSPRPARTERTADGGTVLSTAARLLQRRALRHRQAASPTCFRQGCWMLWRRNESKKTTRCC